MEVHLGRGAVETFSRLDHSFQPIVVNVFADKVSEVDGEKALNLAASRIPPLHEGAEHTHYNRVLWRLSLIHI